MTTSVAKRCKNKSHHSADAVFYPGFVGNRLCFSLWVRRLAPAKPSHAGQMTAVRRHVAMLAGWLAVIALWVLLLPAFWRHWRRKILIFWKGRLFSGNMRLFFVVISMALAWF